MNMNRIKFSEGGQPVYLDDLQQLQENGISSMATLLNILGNGERAFLLQRTNGSGEFLDQDDAHITFLVKAGTVVVNGEFLSWEDTTIKVPLGMMDSPLYICIKTVEADRRQFDDGQERPCRIQKQAYISLDHTGVSDFYNYFELPALPDLLKKVVGIKESEAWQRVGATFFNGYSGTVEYKELGDCYRVRVDIRSSNTNATEGSVLLFATDKTFLQYFRSSCEAYMQTENGVLGGQLLGFEGNVHLDIQLPFDDASSPADVPVKIVFEIPK